MGESRPAFLVVDPEYPGSISARKLVLETAKLNVLTAYSGSEAIATLQRFPHVNAVVLNAEVRDMSCSEAVRKMREIAPKVPIIVISPAGHTSNCGKIDDQLSSYDPQALLELLQERFSIA